MLGFLGDDREVVSFNLGAAETAATIGWEGWASAFGSLRAWHDQPLKGLSCSE